MNYRCLLFDLDGTLIDSRRDLVHAVNLMLAETGGPPLGDQLVMRFVGEGAPLLVARALEASFGREPVAGQIETSLAIFRRHYRAHLLDTTQPYPEVIETLEHFAHLPRAVVTNKPYDFTILLLDGLGLRQHFTAVLGGDSLAERKPSPAPLLEAARRCHRAPQDCLMVGDTGVDMRAGRAARMRTCGYIGGFRGKRELIEAGADLLIERFSELRAIVGD